MSRIFHLYHRSLNVKLSAFSGICCSVEGGPSWRDDSIYPAKCFLRRRTMVRLISIRFRTYAFLFICLNSTMVRLICEQIADVSRTATRLNSTMVRLILNLPPEAIRDVIGSQFHYGSIDIKKCY